MSQPNKNIPYSEELRRLPIADRVEMLTTLRDKLFQLANSFSGDDTGHIAVQLHQGCNSITRSIDTLTVDAIS